MRPAERGPEVGPVQRRPPVGLAAKIVSDEWNRGIALVPESALRKTSIKIIVEIYILDRFQPLRLVRNRVVLVVQPVGQGQRLGKDVYKRQA